MIFDLTDSDIERILLIHHLLVIALAFIVAILWAKVSVMKKKIKKLSSKNR